jgi:hypothetical protein
MLSFISLHKENWRSHSYAAARCVGDQVLFQMLKANSNIDTVCLCMGNDAEVRRRTKEYPTNSLAKRIVRSLRRRSDRCHLS